MFRLKNKHNLNRLTLFMFGLFGILITHDMTPKQYDILLKFGPKSFTKKHTRKRTNFPLKKSSPPRVSIQSEPVETHADFSMDTFIPQE